MPVISVPKEFFISERNTIYGSWGSAFWRELLSNSLDAGANKIMVRGRFHGEEEFRVDFLDNGKGMSREIIENVYMRLGESTKREGDGIGGFGRARILTCFSHDGYRIRTGDVVVSGQGASYEITRSDTAVKGCAITVSMRAGEVRHLMRGLTAVLRQSHLRCLVLVDMPEADPSGNRLPAFEPDHVRSSEAGLMFTGWSRKGRSFRTLADENGDWAIAHVSEGATAVRGRSIVRVNGMAMFEDHIEAGVQVTVDLKPERAREVLTASRDSIRHPFRGELQRLQAEIAADTRSAFRDRGRAPETAMLRSAAGSAGFRLGAPEAQEAHDRPADPDRPDSQDIPPPSGDLPEERHRMKAGRQEAVEVVTGSQAPGMRLPFVLHIGNPTREQRAAASRFREEAIARNGGMGRSSELLHAAWTAACRVAIEKLTEIRPWLASGQERWATGFVFDESLGACHMRAADCDHALLLNPVDAGGRLRFRISDPASMKQMTALALHEVSHIVSNWHDERFAGALTDLVGGIRDSEMDRAIRQELEAARSWIPDRKPEMTAAPEREEAFPG